MRMAITIKGGDMNFDDLFEEARKHPDARIAGVDLHGNTRDLPTAQVLAQASDLARRLQASGLRKGMQVGLQLANCHEYLVWDLACLCVGAVVHALPEELPVDKVAGIIGKHHAALWVCQKEENFQGMKQRVAAADTELATFPVDTGATVLADADVYSRVYSSGTSGYLKGLEISRRGTEYLVTDFIRDFGLCDTDSHLIFLPLSNYQQRMSVYGCLWAGASFKVIHHTTVFQELGRYRPSFIVAPPTIYENIHHLFGRGPDARATLTAFFGGNIRFMITGMAPIRKELLSAFNGHGLNLVEAYGVTETGMIAWNTVAQQRIGSVGRPIHPEHVHFSAESEIVIRRPYPLTKTYFDSAGDDRAATFQADGSILTGDIGTLDAEGFLSLSGRKKEIIVTGGGAKFHPEELERVLLEIDGVKHAVVMLSQGDNRVVAVLVTADPEDAGTLARLDRAIAALNETLPSYQRIQRRVVSDAMPSIDNGMLTRNLKCDRRSVYRHFQAAIEGHQGSTV